ncbi:MAG: hypothetical protein QXD11_01020 [Candidatus Micrarchaeaceae archaeon]
MKKMIYAFLLIFIIAIIAVALYELAPSSKAPSASINTSAASTSMPQANMQNSSSTMTLADLNAAMLKGASAKAFEISYSGKEFLLSQEIAFSSNFSKYYNLSRLSSIIISPTGNKITGERITAANGSTYQCVLQSNSLQSNSNNVIISQNPSSANCTLVSKSALNIFLESFEFTSAPSNTTVKILQNASSSYAGMPCRYLAGVVLSSNPVNFTVCISDQYNLPLSLKAFNASATILQLNETSISNVSYPGIGNLPISPHIIH